MTENEFKLMDLEFRMRASRLCRAKFQEVKGVLDSFLNYIERTAALNDYIHSCNPNMTDDVAGGWGEVTFDFGNDLREETGRQYRVLKYANEGNNADRIFAIGRAFDRDTHYQASTEGFIHGVVTPFVDNLTLYIHSIAMNVCATPERNIIINASGNNTQINIAQDNAHQDATQSIEASNWESLSDSFRKLQIVESDIQELKSILQEERPATKGLLGGRTKKWIMKIAGKIAGGVANLPFETASSILSTAICRYFGWS